RSTSQYRVRRTVIDFALRSATGSYTLSLLDALPILGRGPLAGPVVAACVALKPGTKLRGVRDSKTLTAPKREEAAALGPGLERQDRKSTRLNSSHVSFSYAVFCLKKKYKDPRIVRQL